MTWLAGGLTVALLAWVFIEHATYRGGNGPIYAAAAAFCGIPVIWIMTIASWWLP
jgi:hypothetical protein